MPRSVAVTSRSFSTHPVLRAELLEQYSDAVFNDEGAVLRGPSLVRFLKGHTKAITALEAITDEVLAALPELGVISKYGVGVDTLDLEAMEKRGVKLGWTPGVNARSVAELTVSFALALRHQVPLGFSEIRRGVWRQVRGHDLTGTTFGIVGCGHIGKLVVQMLSPFRCRILVHDIRDYRDFYCEHGIEAVPLEQLLRESDVVTLHVPLDGSTRGMLSADRLRLLPKGAIVINTARGGLVDEIALSKQLASGALAGAALDVFELEPPKPQDLLRHPTFLATPHIGGSSEEAVLAMGRAAIRGLDAAKPPSSYEELAKLMSASARPA